MIWIFINVLSVAVAASLWKGALWEGFLVAFAVCGLSGACLSYFLSRQSCTPILQEPIWKNWKLNSDKTVAVSNNYYWQPIETCPHGVKLQLLGAGGVAHYSTYHGDKFWTHWCPLPKIPKA